MTEHLPVSEMKRVLVCGGRGYSDRNRVFSTLDELAREYGQLLIIEGGAPGADVLAKAWALINRHTICSFAAEWRKFGRAAGPIRNRQMLQEGKPDLVVAFKGGNGTADMVRRARRAGVEVVEVSEAGP